VGILQDFDMGLSAFHQWQFRAAQLAFHKCLATDSNCDPAFFVLGLAQLMGGMTHAAIESFTSFLYLECRRGSSICASLGRYKLGLAQKCNGQLPEALDTLMAGYAVSLLPARRWPMVGPRPFIFEVGLVHLELDRPDLALECFNLAKPEHFLGAAATLQMAQYSISKRHDRIYEFSDHGLEFALTIGEVGNLYHFYSDAAIAYHQALCLERLGRDAAEAQLEARKLDPSYTGSRFDKLLIEKIKHAAG
jgi:tetratricopeptide (TPR) repeat protein